MEAFDPLRKPCKVWQAHSGQLTSVSKLLEGQDPLVLQDPVRSGAPKGEECNVRSVFADLTVSVGVVVAYLMQKATQKVTARFKLETKDVAQQLCVAFLNEALRDSRLQVTRALVLSPDCNAMVDARELIYHAVADDSAKRNAAESSFVGFQWLCRRWEHLRPTAVWMHGAMVDHCPIGAALVFLFEEFGYEHLTRDMNVGVSALAIPANALEWRAKLLPQAASLSVGDVQSFKTPTGRQQHGAKLCQDGM